MEAEAATTTPRPASIYEAVLDESDREAYRAALGVEGIDHEIALVRMRVRRVLKEEKADLVALGRALTVLARALVARMKLDPDAMAQVEDAVRRVLAEMAEMEERHAG
jgi:hypothetical protein